MSAANPWFPSTSPSECLRLGFLAFVLALDRGQGEGAAEAVLHAHPAAKVVLRLAPGEEADPGLDVVVDAQAHVAGLGDAARRVGDLVLGPLVLEREEPALGVHGLASRRLAQLLHGGGPDVGQVVRRGGRDDGVPDDGAVGLVRGQGRFRRRGIGPLRRHVYKHLLRVPGEERGQVGVQAEFHDGIFLLLGAVVMGAALDSTGRQAHSQFWGGLSRIFPLSNLHLHVRGLDMGARRPVVGEIGGGNEGGDHECDGGEEAEDILYAGQGVVHVGD